MGLTGAKPFPLLAPLEPGEGRHGTGTQPDHRDHGEGLSESLPSVSLVPSSGPSGRAWGSLRLARTAGVGHRLPGQMQGSPASAMAALTSIRKKVCSCSFSGMSEAYFRSSSIVFWCCSLILFSSIGRDFCGEEREKVEPVSMDSEGWPGHAVQRGCLVRGTLQCPLMIALGGEHSRALSPQCPRFQCQLLAMSMQKCPLHSALTAEDPCGQLSGVSLQGQWPDALCQEKWPLGPAQIL